MKRSASVPESTKSLCITLFISGTKWRIGFENPLAELAEAHVTVTSTGYCSNFSLSHPRISFQFARSSSLSIFLTLRETKV